MNANIEFLNYIYQNSQMGVDTIKQLMGIVDEGAFKNMLTSQYNEYQQIHIAADQLLQQQKKEAKDIHVLAKISAYISINLNTLTNKSPSHISEMLIQGSTMGIIDITKNIKKYPTAESSIIDLANRLLQFEQQNTEECKKFL